MTNYIVEFSIKIPVSGNSINDKVDAYYRARDEFTDFNVDEFDKKITEVDEKTVKELRETINLLHKNQR